MRRLKGIPRLGGIPSYSLRYPLGARVPTGSWLSGVRCPFAHSYSTRKITLLEVPPLVVTVTSTSPAGREGTRHLMAVSDHMR